MPSLTRNVVVSLIESVKVYEGGDIEIVLDCDDENRKITGKTAGYGKAGGINGKKVKNTAKTVNGYTKSIIKSV